MNSSLMQVFNRLPISFTRGEGVWLWDQHGKKYLDANSGIAVCNLGHSHPSITQVIREQAGKLLHVSNGYVIPEQETLAIELCKLAKMDNAFFCNSGAEANEAALKLARLFGKTRNIHAGKIIVFEKSYHGRTLATLSASGNQKIQEGFSPLLENFIRCPFNDLVALKRIIQENSDIVAIHVEPILGNAGVIVPERGYLRAIRALCDQYNLLMMLDEVQTGLGRTGELFAFEHEEIIPDVLCLAKALGNGIPIGACLARGDAAHLFKLGNHGSTFGGNPFACQVARTVIRELSQKTFLESAARKGEFLMDLIKQRLAHREEIQEIRGKGMMIGIQLNISTQNLTRAGLEYGLLFNVTGENCIRIIPPLILQENEAIELVERLVQTLDYFIEQNQFEENVA